MPLGRSCEQFLQRSVEFHRDRKENHDGRIVDTPFEPSHHIRMDARLERKRLLAQVAPFTAFPHFFAETPEDRSCAHAQGSFFEQDTV
jgi:hypothetical protein